MFCSLLFSQPVPPMLFSRTRDPCFLVGPLSLTLLSFAPWEGDNDVARGRGGEEGLMTKAWNGPPPEGQTMFSA